MFGDDERGILLSAAEQTLRQGVLGDPAAQVEVDSFPPPLRELRASFVTLEKNGALRGCIGMLKAVYPLIQDVVNNAYAAGFRDHRFTPLSADEIDDLHIHISVLSVPEVMRFRDEDDLLSQLVPGRDGLILSADGHRGTYLPSVWDKLPDPRGFVRSLKGKAGLPADYWSDDVRVERYFTEGFGRDVGVS